jgi:high-affinity K+ transport system ATPase subunit B
MSNEVDFVRQWVQGKLNTLVPSLLTRRCSMKKILLSLMAVVCFTGFSALSFAEEMGKMKGEMKGEMMKAKKDEMKAKKDEMKGEMKADHDKMKGEMKMKKDEMKGEMKGAMGK